MKKSVRTIYGALLDTAKRFNEPLPILPNSTLNQKFGVSELETIRIDEFPHTQYFAIGLKGTDIKMDTDGLYVTKYREYNPRWASLLGHVPFVMRPVGNDLTAQERLNYRMRRIEEHNGQQYVAYYLRKLDASQGSVGVEHRKLIDNNIVPSAWEPTLADLNPTPITANPNQVIRTGDDYLSAVRRFELNFTPNDIQEIMDAVNIIYGDPDKANLTEFALVSGVDRSVQGSFNGTLQNYTEAIYAQVTDFVKSTISCPNALLGTKIFLDAGSNEPLLIVGN